MSIRRFLLALFLLPCIAVLAQAQSTRRIVTDKSPAFLFADEARGRVHVITAGSDADFDGALEVDSGDVAPRWFVIDPATEQIIDSTVFDSFFGSFPLRLGVDLAGQRLYVPQQGRVRAYDIGTLTLVRDTVMLGTFAAVSYDPMDSLLILAERSGLPTAGYIHFVKPEDGTLVAKVRSGISPSQTGVFGETVGGRMEYFTINEGTFGVGNSSVSYTGLLPDAYRSANGEQLGGGGSYILTRGDTAYIALRGVHKVQAIDTRTHRDLSYSPIDLSTTTFMGAYALAFQGDTTLVVGMSSKGLLRVSLKTGAIIDSILLPGNVEAMAVRDSLLFAGSRTRPDDSAVAVVNLNTGLVIDTLQVGPQIGSVFVAANGDLHVIGYGPVNDSTRWWAVYDGTSLTRKSMMNFQGRIDNPLRTYYDPASDSLYMVVSDTLRVYPASAPSSGYRSLYSDKLDSNVLSGVSDGGGYLLLHEMHLSPTPGAEYLHVLSKGGELLGRFQTGRRPIMAARVRTDNDKALSFYVIDRGMPGQRLTTLDLFEFQPSILGNDTLGNGANHLMIIEEAAVVTMNGGHELVVIDMDDWDVDVRIPTGTSGFDGPRESMMVNDDHVLVTTYAGDVRLFDDNGNRRVFPVGGKAEGMTVIGQKVFVASIFAPDYTSDSTVVVFDASSLTMSVERVEDVASATTLEQNYPNPATESTIIRFGIPKRAQVTLTVYTADGEKIETLVDEPMESGSYSAELRTAGLPSGSYIYTLRTGSTVLSRVMKVVR